ncbi:MAG: ABC transporter substrate-binding protein [Thermomicrobiales bacterium]
MAFLITLLSVGLRSFALANSSVSERHIPSKSTTYTSTVIDATPQPRIATPKGDQVLHLAGPAQGPNSLDPALSRDLSSAFLVRQIYRGLTRLDRDLNPVPELAQRIEISADGLTYRFSLRADASFQDGSPITADDVLFSMNRSVDPATAGGNLGPLGGPTFFSGVVGFDQVVSGAATAMSGVSAIDRLTVQIQLAEPNAAFLMKLASAPGSVIDRRDVARGGDWWRAPNGSGPFRIAEWKEGDHMTLAPYDKFYDGAPLLREVDIRLGSRALQSFNLYQAGDIDIDSVSLGGVDRVLSASAGLSDQVTVTPLFAVDYVAFRSDVAPLSDPMIRRAIQLGFPRKNVASVSFDGHYREPDGLVPVGMLGSDWTAAMPAFNLEAAKAAITQSSYKSAENVPPIRIYVSGYSGAESLRDSLKASLGLRIEVIDVDWPDFIGGLSKGAFPAYELYWGADYPDPETFLTSLFGTGRADNYVGYSNPAMDELLRRAATEMDPTRRIDLYRRAQQLLIDDNVIVPMYVDVAYTLQKPAVKGLEVTALGILRLDSVWMEH